MLTKNEQRVWDHLQRMAMDGDEVFLSLEHVAAALNITKDDLMMAAEHLTSLGWIDPATEDELMA